MEDKVFRLIRQSALVLLACALMAGALAQGIFVSAAGEAAPAGGVALRVPKSSGVTVYSGGGASIDASNASDGYVTVKYSGSARAKVRITREGGTTYTYDLRHDGVYEVYPFSCGNGGYQIQVFYNVTGDQYAMALSQTVRVTLTDAMLPFLYPNQFVDFNAESAAVKKAGELAAGASDELGIVSNVYNFVTDNVTYDTAKAAEAAAGRLAGYLPKVDSVLSSQKGICFDYAALMTAMLRARDIPTRMEIGYVSGGVYHAWISVYISGVGWINGAIQFDGTNWKLMDPTFDSSGGGSSEVMKFIGDGRNYQTVYLY